MTSKLTSTETHPAERGFDWTLLRERVNVLGVVWPGTLVALVTAFFCALAISGQLFISPIPTQIACLLLSAATVPFANWLGAKVALCEVAEPTPLAAFANGYALAAASAWALLGAQLMPSISQSGAFVILGWLVALSPFAALVSALALACAISCRTKSSRYWVIQGWSAAGLLLGAILLFGPEFSFLFENSMAFAATSSPIATERRASIRALRAFGNSNDLLRGAYGVLFSALRLNNDVQAADRSAYRSVYYQVTGKPFNTVAPPIEYEAYGRPIDQFWGRGDLGSEAVGTKSTNVQLASSRITGQSYQAAGVGYLEWKMAFSNEGTENEEARMQIKLPAGSVVSRAVLWMNGKPHEATFADKTRAREAYRNAVVVQRRDPLLVTYNGPDRVMVQCFPVPPKSSGSTIEILIGISAPLKHFSIEGKNLVLPTIVESNFDDRSPEVNVRLETPKVESEVLPSAKLGKQFYLVIDGGKELAPFRDELADTISGLSRIADCEVFFASDEISHLTDTVDGATLGAEAAKQIKFAPFVGGPDNGDALEAALTKAAAHANSVVIWLHGPQPLNQLLLSTTLRSKHLRNLPFYEVDVAKGPFNCSEQLSFADLRSWDRSSKVLSKDVLTLAVAASNGNPFEEMQPPGASDFRATSAIAALQAAQKTHALLVKDRNKEANAIAQSARIVTPITAAVVLDRDEQYFNFGIEAPGHVREIAPLYSQGSLGSPGPSRSFGDPLSQSFDTVSHQLNALNSYSATTSNKIPAPPLQGATSGITAGSDPARPVSQGSPGMSFMGDSFKQPVSQSFDTVTHQLNALNSYSATSSNEYPAPALQGATQGIITAGPEPTAETASPRQTEPGALQPWQLVLILVALFSGIFMLPIFLKKRH